MVFFIKGGPARRRGHTEEQIPGSLAAMGGRDDRGGGVPAARDHRADFLHVETEIRRAGAGRIAGAPATARREHETEALVADLSLDRHLVQEIVPKKL